jgi:hypothetical protein
MKLFSVVVESGFAFEVTRRSFVEKQFRFEQCLFCFCKEFFAHSYGRSWSVHFARQFSDGRGKRAFL